MMIGAWITDNCEIYRTTDVLNHEHQLTSCNLDKHISLCNIEFSQNEISQHLDLDMRYKAFKCGYIRITSFENQLALECIISLMSTKQISTLGAYIQETFDLSTFKDIVIEDPLTHSTQFFTSFAQLMNFLMQCMDNK